MATKTQVEKYLAECPREELLFLKEQIETLLDKSCNVATTVVPKSALFDTCADPNVFVLEINEQTITDFQKLRKAEGEDIRKTIIALMDYYSNNDQLNILL